MNQNPSTTPCVHTQPCPSRTITVELALATVEELDHLAELQHLSRQQLTGQLITAALLSDTPHLPCGEDPVSRLAEHAYLTHRRSLELAAEGRAGR